MDAAEKIQRIQDTTLAQFQEFIQDNIRLNKAYLDTLFWVLPGSQMTLLNLLIDCYVEPPSQKTKGSEANANELKEKIEWVVALSRDNNIGGPVHQAIGAGKIKLALHLLSLIKSKSIPRENSDNRCFFDCNRRDKKGRTLLSLVIATQSKELLNAILELTPDLHEVTYITPLEEFQPLHQAIVLDFAEGVDLLAHAGANLNNPFGVGRDTPLLLAARLGKIKALASLLEQSSNPFQLEAENKYRLNGKEVQRTAMEELCERIRNNKGTSEAILGVAMLLCHGAEPPRANELCLLLGHHRKALLKAVDHYLKNKPQLVDSFVGRCHQRETPLHAIIYADHSWGSAMRHLLGMPSDAAFIIEDLVVRKNQSAACNQNSTASTQSNSLALYATFVRKYKETYQSQRIVNSWSTMRWMIAGGHCDWETVLRYSKTHPTSRTRHIINQMERTIPMLGAPAEKVSDSADLHQSTLSA